jgi:hypothetical protein
VQVFGRRDCETIRALLRPATEKRQGTKSREFGHRLGSKRYEDCMSAPGICYCVIGGVDVARRIRGLTPGPWVTPPRSGLARSDFVP